MQNIVEYPERLSDVLFFKDKTKQPYISGTRTTTAVIWFNWVSEILEF